MEITPCRSKIWESPSPLLKHYLEDVHFLLPASLLAHLIHVYRRCVVTAVLSAQLVQERHGFLEVRRVKPLGEPAINRGEELAGLSRLALLLPEAGQAHGSP